MQDIQVCSLTVALTFKIFYFFKRYMRKVHYIKNWKQAKLLENTTRQRIVAICSIEPHSLKELSLKLNLNPGSIFNHVSKLKAAGFLTAKKGRVINGIQEIKYSKSALKFDYSRIEKSEWDKRNLYISKDFGKTLLSLLDEDPHCTARKINVSLSQEAHRKLLRKINDLKTFLMENRSSGSIPTVVLLAAGRKEEL